MKKALPKNISECESISCDNCIYNSPLFIRYNQYLHYISMLTHEKEDDITYEPEYNAYN